ncbi:hypothetical protein [Lentzea sp. NPDC092896]|uniref:hypothetical protein n=1 Tax=Lentzea sp. NPDC092896 TaxID=3364127 RepID=UPI0038178311
MTPEPKGNGPAFTLFAGIVLFVAGAILLPDAVQDAEGGVPGTYNVRDGTFVSDDGMVTLSGMYLATGNPVQDETVRVINADDRLYEFGSRPQGPLVLVPPILLGVAGLVTSGLGIRRLRQRRGPGT